MMKRIFASCFAVIIFAFSYAYIEVGADAVETMAKPAIYARAACLMDFESGRILFEHNAQQEIPMASTTKIMTAIVAIEKGNLKDIVTVSKNAADTWGSDINLKVGEKLTLSQLLYGLLISSGNDAAVAIAEHVGGSVEGFANLMNEKAKEIGAMHSHFVTPHGLDVKGHYTTADDLALITRYALNNSFFSKIVGTKEIGIPGRKLHNTNDLLGFFVGADGVKTGYTGLAGRCLVASASRGDRRYIAVALGCATRQERVQTCSGLLEYAFNNYQTKEIYSKGAAVAQIEVEKGLENTMQLYTDSRRVSIPVTPDEYDKVDIKMDYPGKIASPIKKGVEIGSLQVIIEGNPITSYKLYTGSSVERKNLWDHIRTLFDVSMRLLG